MNLTRITTIAAALAAAFITATVFAHEDEKHEKGAVAGVPKTYPLTKCVVSDDKLGEQGKVVKATADGTDVYLCCKDCTKDFNKEPKKYVKMVKDAQARPKK